ncbi:hypothetical protein SAMN04487897_103308 [Paenibacillus sp. yr247]|uniref:hypothetical protein n=1 Tax=Paenibacillus sp. yr247 TaxID=1761880 RepID=UPI0008841370|nr:hypothetical protein [Paenibacillus sp. yr247]SDN60352.1 hypothetical protein SAMN04487897_103308 [Paenibacillus sp. yr247]
MALEKEIMEKVKQIRVWKPPYNIKIDNPTTFRLLGAGKQGVVFQIDDERCVKIYFENESPIKELNALQLGGKAGICPKVFFWGTNYIVMEYLKVPSLLDYLQNYPLTKDLCRRIIHLLDTFEQLGFNRFDHATRHIYVLPGEGMKAIDVVHVIKKEPVWLPKKLIKGMGEEAELFLDFVKELSPKWYERWTNHPNFESLMESMKKKR